MRFQRVVQFISFTFFMVLLWLAAFPLVSPIPVEAFLWLDPVILLGTALSTRSFTSLTWLSLMILAFTVFIGRFFCSTICPMGATIDVTDRLVRSGQKKSFQLSVTHSRSLKHLETDYSECIVCETCVRVCPVNAVCFSLTGLKKTNHSKPFSENRRKLIWAGVSGLGAGVISLTDIKSLHRGNALGNIIPPELIRPPGALPEKDFLARCVRCGECMKACPSNTLQPLGLSAGFSAFFSPKITPAKGPCQTLCNVCGHVCPTAAIQPLPVEEKIWAKMGTAHILKHKCLAWEFNKKCMVCDEVCPYNAIEFKVTPKNCVAVPFVNENKCSGCGFYEHFCPVHATAAIVVEPMGAVRIENGSHREKARQMGLSLEIKKAQNEEPETYPLNEVNESGLPPGFTE